jgi:hypothetical protein
VALGTLGIIAGGCNFLWALPWWFLVHGRIFPEWALALMLPVLLAGGAGSVLLGAFLRNGRGPAFGWGLVLIALSILFALPLIRVLQVTYPQ